MKKTILFLLFILFMSTGCAFMQIDDTIDIYSDNTAYLTILVQDGTKNGITVVPVDVKTAIFILTDPLGKAKTNTWTPIGNGFIVSFTSFIPGLHNLKLTDIDSNNVTNTTNANLNLKLGYNYRVTATVGGAISLIVLSNTNTNTFVFDPAKALVLYSETHTQNVTWPTDINTNQPPSSPNILMFTNQTPGEGSSCFKIKVNSNMFDVNFLRYPLVQYYDLSAYSNGTLRMMIKGNKWISVGIHIAANYDIMVHLTNAGLYGYYSNNTWCNVVIPMSEFVAKGVNLSTIYGWIKFYGGYYEDIAGGEEFFIDDVYFYK